MPLADPCLIDSFLTMYCYALRFRGSLLVTNLSSILTCERREGRPNGVLYGYSFLGRRKEGVKEGTVRRKLSCSPFPLIGAICNGLPRVRPYNHVHIAVGANSWRRCEVVLSTVLHILQHCRSSASFASYYKAEIPDIRAQDLIDLINLTLISILEGTKLT